MEIQSQALNGLAQAQQQLAASAERLAGGPLDAVNLAREAVEQQQALRAAEANIQVLKAEDELLDSLFDQRA